MKNRITYIVIFIFIVLSYLLLGYIVNDYNQQEVKSKNEEIKALKKTTKNYKNNNAELLELNKKLEEELSEVNSNSSNRSVTEFKMGERSITTEQLLEIVNSTLKENLQLKLELERKEKLLNFVRKSYGLKIEDSGSEYSIHVKDTSYIRDILKKTVTLETQVDKLNSENESNKYLLNFVEKSYGIKASYTFNGDKINYKLSILPFTKIDSALTLYPYYKRRLFKNKKGELEVK